MRKGAQMGWGILALKRFEIKHKIIQVGEKLYWKGGDPKMNEPIGALI